MGLRDLFRRAPPPPEDRFPLDGPRLCDRDKTGLLAEHIAIPKPQRDEDWEERFFDLAWSASVSLHAEVPFQGTDGFHYLRFDVTGPGAGEHCLAHHAQWCLDNGFGAAFYLEPDDPPEAYRYAFSYGQIDSLVSYDSPWGDRLEIDEFAKPLAEGKIDLTKHPISSEDAGRLDDCEGVAGPPRSDFLTPHAARAIGCYLEQVWGLPEPRVQFMAHPKTRPFRLLVIGCRPEDFSPEESIVVLMEMLRWFLPPLRVVLPMDDDWSLEEMTPLRTLAGLEEGEDWWPQA